MAEAVLASVNDAARVEAYLRDLQSRICQALESLDGSGQFAADPWTYAGGGGGTSRVLQSGQVFEKGGVNFSAIHGVRLPPAATATRTDLNDLPFSAMGVSLVIHPWNPHVPTTHMNVRFIRVDEHKWWFGGGFDLTPYYGYVEDAVHWHQVAAKACESFGTDLYPRLKRWCDEYFFIKHRGEARGIGGIFYDDFTEGGFESSFAFMQSVADHFLAAYLPIVERRRAQPYGERERQFQCMRRGRYVEFNLVYDRGTLFGLQSGGRTESILMSLPPSVTWHYDWHPEPGSPEARLITEFLTPRDWLSVQSN